MTPRILPGAGPDRRHLRRTAPRRLGVLLGALALLAAPASAAEAPSAVPAQVRAGMEALVSPRGVSGVVVMAGRDGRMLVEASAGDLSPDSPIAVASASKWIAAAVVMSVVDEGRLSLETEVGAVLTEVRGPGAHVTLRQLLSFTAGHGGLMGSPDLRPPADSTLQEAAAAIAARPFHDPPGAVFRYGGPSLQVAGAMAERATGLSWAVLFQTRIAAPLGLERTWWGDGPRPATDRGRHADHPNLQAGLVTTARDYLRFLEMIADRGRFQGRRVLSEQTVEWMESVQAAAPREGSEARYALGNWCEAHEADGRCTVVSSPGAWGAFPWVDRETGLYGLVFMDDRLARVRSDVHALRDLVRRHAGLEPVSSTDEAESVFRPHPDVVRP